MLRFLIRWLLNKYGLKPVIGAMLDYMDRTELNDSTIYGYLQLCRKARGKEGLRYRKETALEESKDRPI